MCFITAGVGISASMAAAMNATLAASLMGTAVATTGMVMQTVSANKAAEYRSDLAKLQAEDAIARGQEKESKHRMAVDQFIGKQRTGFAASGVKVDVGSAFGVIEESAYLGNLDALTIRYNAQKEAWAYESQANAEMTQSPLLAGSATLLTGATRFGNQYANYRYMVD